MPRELTAEEEQELEGQTEMHEVDDDYLGEEDDGDFEYWGEDEEDDLEYWGDYPDRV